MNVNGKRSASELPNPLVVKKLCIGEETKVEYCLPEDAPPFADAVMVSATGQDELVWASLPGVTNVLQREKIYASADLGDWSTTQAADPTEYNRHWVNSAVSASEPDATIRAAYPWADAAVRNQVYSVLPTTDVNEWGALGVGGGSQAGAVQTHLWFDIPVDASQLSWQTYDYMVLSVRLNVGGIAISPSTEFWDVYVEPSSPVLPQTPIYNLDYPSVRRIGTNLSPGQVRQGQASQSFYNTYFELRVDPKVLAEDPAYLRVVLQHTGENYGKTSDHWLSHGGDLSHQNVFGGSASFLSLSGVVSASGQGVVIPEDQIDHNVIQNIGTNTHAQLDTFKANLDPAFDIDPALAGTRFHAANIAGRTEVFSALGGAGPSLEMDISGIELEMAGSAGVSLTSGATVIRQPTVVDSAEMEFDTNKTAVVRCANGVGTLIDRIVVEPTGTLLVGPESVVDIDISGSEATVSGGPLVVGIDPSESVTISAQPAAPAKIALQAPAGLDSFVSYQSGAGALSYLTGYEQSLDSFVLESGTGVKAIVAAQDGSLVAEGGDLSVGEPLAAQPYVRSFAGAIPGQGALVVNSAVAVDAALVMAQNGTESFRANARTGEWDLQCAGQPVLSADSSQVVTIPDGGQLRLGSTTSDAADKCVTMIFPSASAIPTGHVVTIIDSGGTGKVEVIPFNALDSVPVVGVTMNTTGAADEEQQVCIGGMFSAVVEDGELINVGDILEKSDTSGQDGRVIAGASRGTFGIAMTGGTGDLLGTLNPRVNFQAALMWVGDTNQRLRHGVIRVASHDAVTKTNNSNFTINIPQGGGYQMQPVAVTLESVTFPHTFPNVKAEDTFITTKYLNGDLPAVAYPNCITIADDSFTMTVHSPQTGIDVTFDVSLTPDINARAAIIFAAAVTADIETQLAMHFGMSGTIVMTVGDNGLFTITALTPEVFTFSVKPSVTSTRDVLDVLFGFLSDDYDIQRTTITSIHPPWFEHITVVPGWYTDNELTTELATVAAGLPDPYVLTFVNDLGNGAQSRRWRFNNGTNVSRYYTTDNIEFVYGHLGYKLGFTDSVISQAVPARIFAQSLPALQGEQVVYVESSELCSGVRAFDPSQGAGLVAHLDTVEITAPYRGIQVAHFPFAGYPRVVYSGERTIDQISLKLVDRFGADLDIGDNATMQAVIRVWELE